MAFTFLVVIARWRWFHNSFDTYFNSSLTLLLVAEFFRDPHLQHALAHHSPVSVTWSQQLSAVCLGWAATEFIGFTMLWAGVPERQTRARQRRYRLMAVGFAAAYLACGTRARNAGQPLEVADGWDRPAAWAFSVVMLLILSIHLFRRSAAALRATTMMRERLIVAGAVALGVTIQLTCGQEVALQITDQLGWTNTATYRIHVHGISVFYAVLIITLFGAVPCFYRMAAELGLDSASTSWRRLQQMRHGMRSAVPGCVFEPEFSGPLSTPSMRLHHTVVEIRDAMLQLRLYAREIAPADLDRLLDEVGAPPEQRADAIQAIYLAAAARNKIGCATPASVDPQLIDRPSASTLEEEAKDLIRLATWWPAACAAVTAYPARIFDDTTPTGGPAGDHARRDDSTSPVPFAGARRRPGDRLRQTGTGINR